MGNILIAFGILGLIIFVIYLVSDKNVQEEYENGWIGWFEDSDDDDVVAFVIGCVVVLLVSWALSSGITKGIVTEKYKEQRESIITSYKGTGDKNLTIGRHDGCYYVMQNTDGKLEKLQLYESSTDIIVGTFDTEGETGTLITEVTIKKIQRSKMPFMFLSKKDKTKESGCGCGSGTHILKVPANFVFIDF